MIRKFLLIVWRCIVIAFNSLIIGAFFLLILNSFAVFDSTNPADYFLLPACVVIGGIGMWKGYGNLEVLWEDLFSLCKKS